eukprot:scaffold116246_cov44-Prasinocladus_malaysianus.AAC.2
MYVCTPKSKQQCPENVTLSVYIANTIYLGAMGQMKRLKAKEEWPNSMSVFALARGLDRHATDRPGDM